MLRLKTSVAHGRPLGPVGGHVDKRSAAFQAHAAACMSCWLLMPLTSIQLALSLALQVYSSTQPLRIGYYETDFFTMPSPAMRRAIRETKQLLEDAGHTVGCCMNPIGMLHLPCFWDPWVNVKQIQQGKGAWNPLSFYRSR